MSSHEPIHLPDDWHESRSLIGYEINRNAANIHDLRGEINAASLRAVEQREADLRRIDQTVNSYLLRMAVLEAKVILYGLISGAVGMAVMGFVLNWFLKKF